MIEYDISIFKLGNMRTLISFLAYIHVAICLFLLVSFKVFNDTVYVPGSSKGSAHMLLFYKSLLKTEPHQYLVE